MCEDVHVLYIHAHLLQYTAVHEHLFTYMYMYMCICVYTSYAGENDTVVYLEEVPIQSLPAVQGKYMTYMYFYSTMAFGYVPCMMHGLVVVCRDDRP